MFNNPHGKNLHLYHDPKSSIFLVEKILKIHHLTPKNGQKWAKMVKNDQKWPKMTKNGQN